MGGGGEDCEKAARLCNLAAMDTNSTTQRVLLSGDEALARGAFEAGVKVACAYPGTPSTEILENLARFSQVDTQWSVNEKVAFEVAHGASVGGVRSLYASKHVGLNVAMDPLMTASYTGVLGGFVVVVCDDPGMHSSQNEQDSRWVSMFGKLPLIEPAGPAEAYLFVKEAFEISERFDTPVIVRMTTRVAHSKEDVEIGQRIERKPFEFAINIPKYVMVPRNAYKRHGKVEERQRALAKFAETTPLNRIERGSNERGFITSGVSYYYIKQQFPEASILKLGFSYPFCDATIASFARSVKELHVIEELDPIIEDRCRQLGLSVRAKHPSFRIGELRPEYMTGLVSGDEKVEEESTARRPVLCRGCPHRFVFTLLRKTKAVVAGDIGCYTLGASPPLSALHSCVCMGASVTFHEGLRRALPDKKIVGVIGDSTFVHSGITGLINAVYNKVNGLIIILDNGTTAMTGGQDNPATGKTITETPTRKLVLEELCKACGVDNVDVISPYEVKPLEALIKQRLDEPALSVIIARAPCRLIDREAKPSPEYDKDKCKTCGICLSVDCPAMREGEGGFIEIDWSTCMGCYLCAQVCPPAALRIPRKDPGKG
jgi:indolepyruvate ferredoxin oxidoreductase alpha subunit